MSLPSAGHEDAEHLERLIVMDFRNELKGHKERLYQNHRVRNMLDTMQERAKKLVSFCVETADSAGLHCMLTHPCRTQNKSRCLMLIHVKIFVLPAKQLKLTA